MIRVSDGLVDPSPGDSGTWWVGEVNTCGFSTLVVGGSVVKWLGGKWWSDKVLIM